MILALRTWQQNPGAETWSSLPADAYNMLEFGVIGTPMDVLHRIKRLVASGRFHATLKAEEELNLDGLTPQDAVEAILNAQVIKKVLRSTSPRRATADEKLYVIEGFNYTGTLIYTK